MNTNLFDWFCQLFASSLSFSFSSIHMQPNSTCTSHSLSSNQSINQINQINGKIASLVVFRGSSLLSLHFSSCFNSSSLFFSRLSFEVRSFAFVSHFISYSFSLIHSLSNKQTNKQTISDLFILSGSEVRCSTINNHFQFSNQITFPASSLHFHQSLQAHLSIPPLFVCWISGS